MFVRYASQSCWGLLGNNFGYKRGVNYSKNNLKSFNKSGVSYTSKKSLEFLL